jgi:hypothetical protein
LVTIHEDELKPLPEIFRDVLRATMLGKDTIVEASRLTPDLISKEAYNAAF